MSACAPRMRAVARVAVRRSFSLFCDIINVGHVKTRKSRSEDETRSAHCACAENATMPFRLSPRGASALPHPHPKRTTSRGATRLTFCSPCAASSTSPIFSTCTLRSDPCGISPPRRPPRPCARGPPQRQPENSQPCGWEGVADGGKGVGESRWVSGQQPRGSR